jgi:hypothetical protein
MARHFAIESFWREYEQLPEEVRATADRNFELLKASPNHPSLRFKRIGAVYSARVGLHYRALARQRGDDFYWFWIGPHAEYDRLVRRYNS